jgi:hypothetical protein
MMFDGELLFCFDGFALVGRSAAMGYLRWLRAEYKMANEIITVRWCSSRASAAISGMNL